MYSTLLTQMLLLLMELRLMLQFSPLHLQRQLLHLFIWKLQYSARFSATDTSRLPLLSLRAALFDLVSFFSRRRYLSRTLPGLVARSRLSLDLGFPGSAELV